MSDATVPSGPPAADLQLGRLGVYALLVARVAVLSDPALDHADDLVQVDGGNPRRADLVLAEETSRSDAWPKAWSSACTGLTCDGIRVGFWNSIRILVPSVILSIALGAVTGYALSFYRVRGANLLFAILLIGAFIPYQVFIYPMVRIFSMTGIYNSLACIVIVHVIFGLPLMTLLFRNYYAGLPIELFKAARVDGGGFWRSSGT